MDTYSIILKSSKLLLEKAMTPKGITSIRLNTGRVSVSTHSSSMVALYENKLIGEDEINTLVGQLLNLQIDNSDELKYSWCKVEKSSNWGTARALRALFTVKPNTINLPNVESALLWLINQQNSNGGFGFTIHCATRPVYAYHVSKAFIPILGNTFASGAIKEQVRVSLKRLAIHLTNSQIETGGWAESSEFHKTCPTSTMFAVATILGIEETLKETYLSSNVTEKSIKIIKAGLSVDSKTWPYFEETSLNWKFQIYLPGKVDVLLRILPPSDPFIKDLVAYICSTYIPYENALGWSVFQSSLAPVEKIVLWVTPLNLLSLAAYSKAVSEIPTSRQLSLDATQLIGTSLVINYANKEAKRKTNLQLGVLLGILTSLLLIIGYFVTYFSSPFWQYVFGIVPTVLSYLYFAITKKELSPQSIYNQVVETQKKKILSEIGIGHESN